MRNRQFPLQSQSSGLLFSGKSSDWESLTNKFSARRLFRYSYFDLLNGEMAVLGKRNIRSLLVQILSYTETKEDKNLIPVLQKISSEVAFDENIRQRSAEILKMPWIGKSDFTVARTPQATEILKLLKAQSIESKRLAICMIGKFKLNDMLQEVGNGLTIKGLEIDSSSVFRSFGNDAANELQKLYMRSSGNINTCKAILRILSDTGTRENNIFLFERLWSNSKVIKEAALTCLIDSNFKVPEEENSRFNQLISDVAGNIVWLLSAEICLRKSNNEFLIEVIDKEIIQWKRFLLSLFHLSGNSVSTANFKKVPSDEGSEISVFFPELVDNIFNELKKPVLGLIPGISPEEYRLKRLHHIIPGKIPDYRNLIDDLLNRDYNHLSLWVKACTLRNMKKIEDNGLVESVIALMFSPEELLQEEAARLIARSDMELYNSIYHRILPQARVHLDEIIAGKTEEKGLLFEKTMFLSSLFPGIPEDKLLFLARSISYIKKFTSEFKPNPQGIILWSFQSALKVPQTVKIVYDDSQASNIFSESADISYFYTLDLVAVEEFDFLFPEYSFKIFKYIDDNE